MGDCQKLIAFLKTVSKKTSMEKKYAKLNEQSKPIINL